MAIASFVLNIATLSIVTSMRAGWRLPNPPTGPKGSLAAPTLIMARWGPVILLHRLYGFRRVKEERRLCRNARPDSDGRLLE